MTKETITKKIKQRSERAKYRQIVSEATFIDLCFMHYTHGIGGGAELYLNERIKANESDGYVAVVVSPNHVIGGFTIEISNKSASVEVSVGKLSDVATQLPRVDRIIINELAYYPDVTGALNEIIRLADQFSATTEFLLHDYYCICPGIVLLDENNRYCDIPAKDVCNDCIKKNSIIKNPPQSIEVWRQAWQSFLSCCDNVVAFSQSSIDLFDRIFTTKNGVELIPHQSVTFDAIERDPPVPGAPITVGFLGQMSLLKGKEIIREMTAISEQNGGCMKFVLIGDTDIPDELLDLPDFIQTGAYIRDDIPKLIEEFKVDIIFISSICPETFSFTTKEVISLGIPVACFDLGAQADHVRKYEKGIIVDETSSICAYESILAYFGI